jgi:hypothetical protein
MECEEEKIKSGEVITQGRKSSTNGKRGGKRTENM